MIDVIRFFREVKSELQKVVWPSWSEWVGSTIVVLFLVFLFSIFLGVIDAVFAQAAKYVFKWYGGF